MTGGAALNANRAVSGSAADARPGSSVRSEFISVHEPAMPSNYDAQRKMCQQIIDKCAGLMRELGLSDERIKDALFNIQLVTEELLVNNVKHGNKQSPDKTVAVNLAVSFPPELLARIELTTADQGAGFDPSAVPNPRSLENLLKASGRGVLFYMTYADKVEFTDQGRCCKLTFDLYADNGQRPQKETDVLFIDGRKIQMWPESAHPEPATEPASLEQASMGNGSEAIVRDVRRSA